MRRALEPGLYAALLVILGTGALAEGRREAELERRLPVAPAELYRTLARSQVRWQIIDARAGAGDFDDAHVPGALPFPGCDPARTSPAARAHIVPSMPTVIVTAGGDPAEAAPCLARFTSARVLAGGMEAWSDANLPEDSGDYTPPSNKAGGGCL